jgi:hypothetical protein
LIPLADEIVEIAGWLQTRHRFREFVASEVKFNGKPGRISDLPSPVDGLELPAPRFGREI